MQHTLKIIEYHKFKEILEEFVYEHCIILDGTNPDAYVSIEDDDLIIKELYANLIKSVR